MTKFSYMQTVDFALKMPSLSGIKNGVKKAVSGIGGKASKPVNYFPEVRDIKTTPKTASNPAPTSTTKPSKGDSDLWASMTNRSGSVQSYPMKRGNVNTVTKNPDMRNMINNTGVTKTYKTRQYIY